MRLRADGRHGAGTIRRTVAIRSRPASTSPLVPFAAFVLAFTVLAFQTFGIADARVKALSSDGEATVYLPFDVSKPFVLSYRVSFAPAPKNASWSLVSVLLLGDRAPAAAVSVGLSRGFPNAATLGGFTTAPRGRSGSVFTSFPLACRDRCEIELRGDERTVTARVAGRVVATWSRRNLAMAHPSVQINAEVAAVGDALRARLEPVAVAFDGTARTPACAFTTQGIEARLGAGGTLEFSGRRSRGARVTYVSLPGGTALDRCPSSK